MSSPPPAKRARREFGVMRPDGASFIGSASGIHFVQTVYNAISKAGLPNQIVPGEDDQLPRGATESSLWRLDELDPSQHDQIHLDSLLEWSKSYFDNWHPAFPFLHAPTVIEWLSELCQIPLANKTQALNSLQLAVVRSVMSISLADSRQLGQTMQLPPALVFHSYDEALGCMQHVLIERPSMESLQAAMGIQLFLVSMLRLNGGSRIHGIIIRLILQMGLHRCPSRYPNFTPAEVDVRRRIFWSAYIMDRYLSQCLGLPITLRDDDTDVCFPDEEKHASLGHMDDRLAFNCFIAKHARLKGQVVELCNKSINHRQFDTGPFQDLSIAIAKWTNELEEHIQFSATRTSPLSHMQQCILDALKQEIMLSLNRPLLTAPKTSSDYRASLQTCIKAARSLIVDLHQAVFPEQTASKLVEGFGADTAHFMFWPFLTWSVWISAFFVLFAALEKEMVRFTAVKLSDQSNEILKFLSTRGSIWPNACQAAIQDLFARFCEGVQLSGEQSAPATKAPEESPGIRSLENHVTFPTSISTPSSARLRSSLRAEAIEGDYSRTLDHHVFLGVDPESTLPSASNTHEADMSLFAGFDIPFWLEIDDMLGAEI